MVRNLPGMKTKLSTKAKNLEKEDLPGVSEDWVQDDLKNMEGPWDLIRSIYVF